MEEDDTKPIKSEIFQSETPVKSEVVVLQNIPINQNDSIPILLNSACLPNNSDGNLRIENISFIIETDNFGEGNEITHLTQLQRYDGEIEYTEENEEVEDDEGEEDEEREDDDEFMEEADRVIEEGVIYDSQEEHIEEYIFEEDNIPEPNQEENTDGEIEVKPEIDSQEKNAKAENKSGANYDFICEICLRSFKTKVGLKRHVAVTHAHDEEENDPLTFQLCKCCGEPSDTAHKVGDFKCEICESLFLQQISLERHQSIEHAPEGIYKCADCHKQMPTKEELITHMKVHPYTKFTCKQCNRDFTRRYHLDRHVKQTGCNGAVIVEYNCQVCNKVFRRKDNLREHLKAHVGQAKKRRIYECTFCNKQFLGSALLNIHVRTHTGEKPYGCDFCEKRFPSSGAMKKHRRMHTGEKPYECIVCKQRFAAKETLNRHMRTHTGYKPHVCTYCGKSFIQAVQLRAHIFHHTGDFAYTCPHCGRAFNRQLRLTTHIKFVHEGAEPYRCTICVKTFFRKEDLSRHVLSHTGEKHNDYYDKRLQIAKDKKLSYKIILSKSNTSMKETDECSTDNQNLDAQLDRDSVDGEIRTWTNAPTKLLIALYTDMKPKLGKSIKLKTKKKMWEVIKGEMECNGYHFTVTQIENRWKTLVRSYKKKTENNKATGRSRATCEFETELQQCMSERSSEFLLGANDDGKSKKDLLNAVGIKNTSCLMCHSKISVPSQSTVSNSETTERNAESLIPRRFRNNESKTVTYQLQELRKQRNIHFEKNCCLKNKKIEAYERRTNEIKRKNDILEQMLLKMANKK